MLKVIFYLKAGKFNKSGESPIYARISYKKQSITMASGKSILKERWQFTDNLRSVLKLEKEKVIKNALDLFLIGMEKKFNELLKIDQDFSLQLLKDEFKGETVVKENCVSLIEIMNKHNEFFKKKVNAGERSKASYQKYERAKDLLITFMTKQYGIQDIPLFEVNSAYVYNLESFLKYDSRFKGKTGIKNNSVVKYMRMYKTACKYSIRMGIIEKDPFNLYDGKLHVTDAVFLTQEELNLIESKKFSAQRLEKVKDVFLFSCYTGYAPVDAANLTSNNISSDGKDNLWIMTNRAKTTIRANVPILPPTLAIISTSKIPMYKIDEEIEIKNFIEVPDDAVVAAKENLIKNYLEKLILDKNTFTSNKETFFHLLRKYLETDKAAIEEIVFNSNITRNFHSYLAHNSDISLTPLSLSIEETLRSRTEEQRKKLKEFSYKFHNSIDRIKEMNDIPAYKRMGIELDEIKPSDYPVAQVIISVDPRELNELSIIQPLEKPVNKPLVKK
jgi:hypothetical protein